MLNTRDPKQLLISWFKEACEKADNKETLGSAMTISTADSDGQPTARVVLLKEFTENGFVFFTNYESKKGKDLKINPKVSVNFHWYHLGRQVHVSGTAQKTSRKVSEDYWNTRPRDSQISQCISRQSRPLSVGESLQDLYDTFAREWDGKTIPCPDNWGGIEVVPDSYQFWVAQPNRLHERVEFVRSGDQWSAHQLHP